MTWVKNWVKYSYLKSDMDGNLKKFKKEEFGKMVFLFHFGCDFSGSMFILKGVLIGDGFCLFGRGLMYKGLEK